MRQLRQFLCVFRKSSLKIKLSWSFLSNPVIDEYQTRQDLSFDKMNIYIIQSIYYGKIPENAIV